MLTRVAFMLKSRPPNTEVACSLGVFSLFNENFILCADNVYHLTTVSHNDPMTTTDTGNICGATVRHQKQEDIKESKTAAAT